MAAPDDTQLRGLINSNLPDSPPNRPRRIKAAILRATLFAAIDWVKTGINNNLTTWLRLSDRQPGGANTDAVYRTAKTVLGRDYSNGTAASLEATDAWLDTLNGNRVSPFFTITNSTDGLAATRYFAIGELPAGTGGTFDFAQVAFIGKPWDNGGGSPIELDLYFANRGGFRYQYTSRGDANATGIICQQMSDGRTVIYMVSDNNFKAISARFVNFAQAIIYSTPTYTTNLLGTEVFNSTKPSQYKPIQAFRQRFPSFTITNGDGGFPPAPITEPGSAQLSLGANWIGGSSELAFINSNISGSGFSFWQQAGAATKRLLAFLNGNGDLILGGSGGGASEKLHVIGNFLLNGILKFPFALANKKIALLDPNGNDHQFDGFGYDANGMRYQIDATTNNHIFYAGTSSATSVELMRIQGNGRVGINRSNLAYPFDAGGNNPPDSIVAQFINLTGGGGGNGGFIRLAQVDAGNWDLGVLNNNHFIIRGWNGAGAIVERARFTPDGRFLIGQTVPNDRDLLQVNGSISGKVSRQGGDAQSSELAADCWRVVHNTSTGQTRLVVNIGGSIKSMLFQ
ncbi:hypothetical protein CLV58_101174 [Spirosoma oryzae]|uniref:Uncharacterized protein n=1 Tax=Spirosoma oryzae TaxID=1469603 RepID=A0A2T0TNK0_9BACT|nr:hypothetical protein [Spirosoma oryzae]PRY47108.1 hypothetical protein CLV58_101174 [Spirosoma oryzae]